MVTTAPTEDPRAELERLRKLKRLRELEAKANGGAPPAPQVQASTRAIIDSPDDEGPAALGAFIAKTAKEPPKPKPVTTFPADMGDRSVRGYNALKESGIRGDLVGRAGASAVNSVLGGIDFLSQPGRWADDALHSTGALDWLPAIAWSPEGLKLTTEGAITEEERGRTGLPRIPMPEAKDDADKMADMVGEGIGFVAPGAVVHKGMVKAGEVASKVPGVTAAVNAITAKGSGALERVSRYGQRMASTVPEAGAQAFAFGASTADKAIIDDDGTITQSTEDPVERGMAFASNPLSYVAPIALSGIYRAGVLASTGGKSLTPKAIQAQVAPSMLSATDEAVAALGDLPMPAGIKDADADKALGIMHRALSGGGVPDDVMAAEVAAYNALKGDRPAPAVFLRSRLSAYPKAIENLDNAIYEIGQKSPEVGAALRDMRMTQAERLKAGLRDTLGKGDRTKRDAKLKGDLEDMGEEAYEPILAAGPVDEEAANTLRALLNDTEFAAEIPVGYRTKLSMDAINMAPEAPPTSGVPAKPGQTAGPREQSGPDLMGGDPLRKKIALQQRIAENPLEVAHKLYSSLGQRIRDAKGADTSKLRELRDTIRPHLMKAGGDAYKEVNSAYAATAKARRALSSPDKLFSQSLKSHEVAKVKSDYKAMSPAEKESYKVSLKGLLEDELKRASANNDFVALGRMKREGVLDAIEEILDVGSSTKGTDTAAQIRRILDEQDTIVSTDPSTKTNRGDRLAAGREAYAGKTGAMEHTGRYDLNALAQDVGVSTAANLLLPGSSAVLPIRAIIRATQKAAAALATPSRSARGAFGRMALERPGVSPSAARAAAAARARGQANAAKQYRVNGRFGGKPEFLDPEAPGPRPFDDEGFAASMSDDGPPKIPGGGGSVVDDELTIIDEGYVPGGQKALPNKPKLLGSDRPVTAAVKGETDDTPDAPKTEAERYVDELRTRAKELEAKAEEAARVTDAAKGNRRAEERAAADAEKLRAEADRIEKMTVEEGLKAERERERAAAAVARAKEAAEKPSQPPPEPQTFAQYLRDVFKDFLPPPGTVGNGPFAKFGRMRDRAMAPPGDPRSLRDAMGYLVGEEERAAISNHLRRFGRDQTLEWYNAESINRANELLRAAQGQREGVSTKVRDIVGKLNGQNKKWLVDQLSDPQGFDLLEIMQQIDSLGPSGKLELEYAATAPFAAGAAGLSAAALAGKALYDAREKRTPEQIEASKRQRAEKMIGDDDDVVWPDKTELLEMQKMLNRLNYTDAGGKKLVVDGVTGDRFREAIKKFQDANDLPSTYTNGGLNRETIEFIRKNNF